MEGAHAGKNTPALEGVIFAIAAFSFTLLMSSPLALACINPTIYNQHGVPINTFGGVGLTINGSQYPDNETAFPISIGNKNTDQGMTVTLRPYGGLRDYIGDVQAYLQPNEIVPASLDVWVAGHSYSGAIQVYYECDDGNPQYLFPIVNVMILGKGLAPPPGSTCESHNLDGCYSGMKRDYYCANKQLTYTETCTDSCCKGFGGSESICAADKHSCLTYNTLPPGTEGNIAFICKDKTCGSGNEKYLMFMFRLSGWNVTAKPQNAWASSELDKSDIIACSEESRACPVGFNSVVYNAHTNERKPFLEIPSNSKASAAYAFGYVSSKSGSTGKDKVFVNSADYITSGYSGTVQTTISGTKYATVKDAYLKPEVKDLADSGNKSSSTMFKVKESAGHGRYAFLGWTVGSTALTTDGKILLNNTLKWLKGGDAAFGGQNYDPDPVDDIAFICQKADCSRKNEMSLISFLRASDYKVTGNVSAYWTDQTLSGYNVIICSDSTSCKIAPGSPVYNAYMNSGKAFLEIPSSGDTKAAQTFGISDSHWYRTYGYGIQAQGTAALFDGYTGYMPLFDGKAQLFGPSPYKLLSGYSLAKAVDVNASVIFVKDAQGGRGRYAYVGWVSDVNSLNSNGRRLLTRTIDWLVGGDASLPSFGSVFGDMSLHFDVLSPTNTTYPTTRVYANIVANQYAKENHVLAERRQADARVPRLRGRLQAPEPEGWRERAEGERHGLYERRPSECGLLLRGRVIRAAKRRS